MKRARPDDKKQPKKSTKKASVGPRFWLGVAHRDHVLIGKQEGFVQLCHGKESPLLKLSPGDILVYYSPRTVTTDKSTSSFKSFTAAARILDSAVEKGAASMNRRAAAYLECEEAAIAPLTLSWKPKEGKKWGMALRSGFKELEKEDFDIIANAMKLKLE